MVKSSLLPIQHHDVEFHIFSF